MWSRPRFGAAPMIQITFRDLNSETTKEAWFEVRSPHSFDVAVEYMIDLLARWERTKPSGKFTKESVDPVMRAMQYQYLIKGHQRGITDHELPEAKELRKELWDAYRNWIAQEGISGAGSYNDHRNFNRALLRVSFPKVRISESLSPAALKRIRNE